MLKELLHEAGNPRWIFHGTPAGGAGIHGILEAGVSVVMLCFDEHHRTHLRNCMLQRSVETLVAGTSLVFKDEALQTRSVVLLAAKAASAEEAAVPKEKPKLKKKANAASNKKGQSRKQRGKGIKQFGPGQQFRRRQFFNPQGPPPSEKKPKQEEKGKKKQKGEKERKANK